MNTNYVYIHTCTYIHAHKYFFHSWILELIVEILLVQLKLKRRETQGTAKKWLQQRGDIGEILYKRNSKGRRWLNSLLHTTNRPGFCWKGHPSDMTGWIRPPLSSMEPNPKLSMRNNGAFVSCVSIRVPHTCTVGVYFGLKWESRIPNAKITWNY